MRKQNQYAIAILLLVFVCTIRGNKVSSQTASPFPEERTLYTTALAWSPNDSYLALASYMEEFSHQTVNVEIISVVTQTSNFVPFENPTNVSIIDSVAWNASNDAIYIAEARGKIWEYNFTGNVLTLLYEHSDNYFHFMDIDPSGTRLVTVGTHVNVYDLVLGQVSASFPVSDLGSSRAVTSEWVGWSPDGSRIAVASRDNVARIFDASTHILTDTFVTQARRGVISGAWSPDSQRLALGIYDGIVEIWNTLDGTLEATIPGRSNSGVLNWHPSGHLLYLGQGRVANVENGYQVTRYPIDEIDTVATYNSDGTQLAYGVAVDTALSTQTSYVVPAPGVEPSPTPTETPSPTATDTPTITPTATFTPTPTPSFTPTVTSTDTSTPTASPTATLTPSVTPTTTFTSTTTPTLIPSSSNTSTLTPTATPSAACTVTVAAGDAAGLVAAITTANSTPGSVDVICLAASSTYTFTSAAQGVALPIIISPVTIIGNGATLERGNGTPNFRLFTVAAGGNLTLEGVTLRNGNAGGENGGSILNQGTLTLRNSSLLNSQARYGGALYSSGQVTLENVVVTGSTAQEQGGGVFQAGSTLQVTGGTWENNRARYGASLYNDGGTVTLNGSRFNGSSANEQGAAAYNRVGGTLTVGGGQFTGHSARYGAAIYSEGTLTLADAVLTGNAAQEQGGAVYHNNTGATNAIGNSCLSGNTAREGSSVYSNTPNLNARNNWWGAASGPASGAVNANVQTTPFGTEGCPHTP